VGDTFAATDESSEGRMMTPPFPTVYKRGDEAGFYVDFKLVRVPLRFGSDDMSLHVIPWLFRYWPFIRNNGRLVKVMPDGEYRNLAKQFADVKYRDIGYEFEDIEAVDGNWLNWTGENIRPVRDPHAPATDTAKKNEVERQLRLGTVEGGSRFVGPFANDYVPDSTEKFLARADAILIREALLETLHTVKPHLATTQRSIDVELSTDISMLCTAWEQKQAEDLEVLDAERVQKESKEDQLFDDAEKLVTADERPARSAYKDTSFNSKGLPVSPVPTTLQSKEEKAAAARHARGDFKASPLEVPPTLRQVQIATGQYQRFALVAAHDPAFPHAGTEQVLNAFGWVTPENGHKPTYEGRDRKQVWLRTLPVKRFKFEKTAQRLLPDPKPCVPSEPLPVREVNISEFMKVGVR
jgi:hypothetical protein